MFFTVSVVVVIDLVVVIVNFVVVVVNFGVVGVCGFHVIGSSLLLLCPLVTVYCILF